MAKKLKVKGTKINTQGLKNQQKLSEQNTFRRETDIPVS